jgi:triacylglycerol lipase
MARSKYLVDPDLLPLLEERPALDLSVEMLPAVRQMIAEEAAAAPVADRGAVGVEQVIVPAGAHGPAVRVLAYRPDRAAGVLPALLHIHGGGYVIGLPEMNDAANRALALELGCAIFSVDYRLAPETPHPGPLEDCYAALAWLHDHAVALRIDPAWIGVKGESAGGGLAAALCLLARDRGAYPVAFQHLIYPMIDDRTCVETDPNRFAGEFLWTPALNALGWRALLGVAPGSAGVSAYAAAARAETLAGLPPCFISLGALDLFFDEDLDYARRLARAGVAVELHVYPGAFHAFQMSPAARVTIASDRDTVAALRRAMFG